MKGDHGMARLKPQSQRLMSTKKSPNPTDKYVGARVRMRRMMLGMTQQKLGNALGLTFQQVQKYEKGTNRIGTRFSWNSLGAGHWRAKLGALCLRLNYTPDNYQERLCEDFGKNWVYRLRPLIEAIKLPELHPANECHESLNAAWLTALNERERHGTRKRKDKVTAKAPMPSTVTEAPPVRSWASWIERTLKEDS